MQSYELTIVLDGKTTPAKKKSVSEKIEKLVELSEGKVGKVRDMGKLPLSFKIKKSEEGVFLFFPLSLPKESVAKISEKIKLDDDILRYLLVRA